MKKSLLAFSMIFILVSSGIATVNAQSIDIYTGSVFVKDNSGNYVAVEELVVNYEETKTGNISVISSDNTFSFAGTVSSTEDKLIEAKGYVTYNDEKYEAKMALADNGFSILFYDADLEFLRTTVFSKQGKDVDECVKSVNMEVVPVFENNSMIKEVPTSELDSMSLIDGDSIRSVHPVTKTLHISLDGWVFAFVVSSGAVDGTLTYTKGLDPTQQFVADKLEGFVAWETGMDGISITNSNETYGTLWGTPECPARTNQTWYIGKGAECSGTYYLTACVSYTTVVKLIPVVGWETEKKAID